MLRTIFVFILILRELTSSGIMKGSSCLTPYQEYATCLPVLECTVIKAALATLTPQAFQFARDSQCGCDMGMVCCGSLNNKSYPLLTNCAPPPEDEKVILSSFSDESVCGIDVLSYRIKGGQIAKFEEFPWLAALEYESKYDNKNAGIRCGGSLINRLYILTAAHCIVHVEFVVIKAWLGVTNITSEENCLTVTGSSTCVKSVQKINVAEGIPYPNYMSVEGFNDIGLLRLEKSIEYSDYIRPICLPSPDSRTPRVGTYMTIAGWGATEKNTLSDIKLKVDLPLQNISVCNEYLRIRDKEVNADQLCVGGIKGKDSCQGDSGGPLMNDFTNANGDVQWYQEGIVSYGSGCGIQGRPAVYAKVSSYIDWIVIKIHKVQINLGPGDPCTTAHGNIGSCVTLEKCPAVAKAASTKNENGKSFAGKSLCDLAAKVDEAVTLVCCEKPGDAVVPNYSSTALPNKDTCGVLKKGSKVEGTGIADLGEFPWVVGIEYNDVADDSNAGIRCAGSIIHPRYILTTGNCLFDLDFEPISVWVGDWNVTTDPDCEKQGGNVECAYPVQKFGINKTIPHVYYNPRSGRHDIGLILLDKDIKYTDYVGPICLPTIALPPLEEEAILTTATWGYTENRNFSEILRKMEIHFGPNKNCNISVSTAQFCVKDQAVNSTCREDAGGPLMRAYENKASGRVQWYQEGVASYGHGCGGNGYPVVYNKITNYMYWIINLISEDNK